MRLIDADALTDELIKGMEADTDKSTQATFAKSVCMILCKAIENQPTVDAVPVVRCKDCKWYYRGGATCLYWDGENGMCGDDYCSRAERKEE